jgi:hypothetical protein
MEPESLTSTLAFYTCPAGLAINFQGQIVGSVRSRHILYLQQAQEALGWRIHHNPQLVFAFGQRSALRACFDPVGPILPASQSQSHKQRRCILEQKNSDKLRIDVSKNLATLHIRLSTCSAHVHRQVEHNLGPRMPKFEHLNLTHDERVDISPTYDRIRNPAIATSNSDSTCTGQRSVAAKHQAGQAEGRG